MTLRAARRDLHSRAVPPGSPLHVWIVHAGEPIAGLDAGARSHRYGMLANALLGRGHEVTWWNSTFQHLTKRYRARAAVSLELRPRLMLRLLHGRPRYRRNVSAARWLHHRAIARQFTAAVASEPAPDVIVACLPTPELCEAAVCFGQQAHVPVVVDIQDPWPDIYLSVLPRSAHPVVRRLLSPEYARLARILHGAWGMTAVSDAYLKWGIACGAGMARASQHAFPLGYEPACSADTDRSFPSPAVVRARYGISPNAHLVVFSGSFGQSYDLDAIAECASLMYRERRSAVHFVLAGEGDRMAWLRRRSSGLPNLTLTGWLDQQSLAELIRSASIGLCAYAPHATQTLPYKSFEYMAAGLPQVSSLRGELAELIRTHDLGRQYDPGAAASLKSAVLAILDLSPAARDQMGRNARALFQRRFDGQRIYPDMAAFVESFALRTAAAELA